MRLTKRFLCFPVRSDAKPILTRITLPGLCVRCAIPLAEGEPEYWTYFDARAYQGQLAEIAFEAIDSDPELICILADIPPGVAPYNETSRPLWRFTAPRGWINDPNGMVKIGDTYHLMYQANPLAARGYDKGWGHMASRDLFSWRALPQALWADENGYAISGCALIDTENRAGFGKNAWILCYATRMSERQDLVQRLCLAYSTDGVRYRKYDGNPILLDPGEYHFRDPKVFWYEPENCFCMVLACGSQLRFYQSTDLREWTQTGAIDPSFLGRDRMMYECPELMEYDVLDEGKRWALCFSGDKTVYAAIGDFDGRIFRRDPNIPIRRVDQGPDFYAAVAFHPNADLGNRKLWFGWMGSWHYAMQIPTPEGWSGLFACPRDLSLERGTDGELWFCQRPVSELCGLEDALLPFPEAAILASDGVLEGDVGEAFDLQFSLEGLDRASLTILYESGEHAVIRMDTREGRLTIDRSECDRYVLGDAFAHMIDAPIRAKSTMRLLADRGGLELYWNDGRYCLSTLVFPQKHRARVRLMNESTSDWRVLGWRVRPIHQAGWEI